MSIVTKFEIFKEDSKQTHNNIKLVKVRDLTEDEYNDTKFVRKVWDNYFKGNQNEGSKEENHD